jgi:hypothetical protein
MSYVWVVEENKKAGFPASGWTPVTHKSQSMSIPVLHPSRSEARRAAQDMFKRDGWPMKNPYILVKYRAVKYVREE